VGTGACPRLLRTAIPVGTGFARGFSGPGPSAGTGGPPAASRVRGPWAVDRGLARDRRWRGRDVSDPDGRGPTLNQAPDL